jgi:hypothetical protein
MEPFRLDLVGFRGSRRFISPWRYREHITWPLAARVLDLDLEAVRGEERRRLRWQRAVAGLIVVAVVVSGAVAVQSMQTAKRRQMLQLAQ